MSLFIYSQSEDFLYLGKIHLIVGICNKEMIVNNNISIEERKLFQETLARLEKENERLMKIIEKLSGIKE